MTALPKYNRLCSLHECQKWMRDGDIFCKKCYMSLPQNMRNALWSRNPRELSNAIHLAKEFLYEQLQSQSNQGE